MERIYLDNAATTQLSPVAEEAMRRAVRDGFGNPASSHAFGRKARQMLEDARERIAARLDAQPEEVVFTSGATEANNLAILRLATPSGTFATASIEHPCVLESIAEVERRGGRRLVLDVDRDGVLILPGEWPEDLRLVAAMLVNHETGARQPVETLTKELGGRALVLCDAAAAVGKIPVSFRKLDVHALAFSAHKFHGPIGIGALMVRKGVKLPPMLFGGHQQQSRRPGTESPMLAVGMAAALDEACENLERNMAHVAAVRTSFLQEATAAEQFVVHGGNHAIPYVANVSFTGLKADALLIALDLAGIACSAGSACSSGSLLPSPVLRAMGLSEAELTSALRFSFSRDTTLGEAAEAARRITRSVRHLRQAVDVEV
ncbi:MAG: cysteine desulfurase [Gemmataceae bacterium]|nr:cysteine desulfurase [Gemmataceae bacterium]